jgi:hypothetical protein
MPAQQTSRAHAAHANRRVLPRIIPRFHIRKIDKLFQYPAMAVCRCWWGFADSSSIHLPVKVVVLLQTFFQIQRSGVESGEG